MPTVWSIVNDSLRADDMWLIYLPHIIALAAIYIATIYNPKDITASWFDNLNVDIEEVREAALDLAEFYQRNTGGLILQQQESSSSSSLSNSEAHERFLKAQSEKCF